MRKTNIGQIPSVGIKASPNKSESRREDISTASEQMVGEKSRLHSLTLAGYFSIREIARGCDTDSSVTSRR